MTIFVHGGGAATSLGVGYLGLATKLATGGGSPGPALALPAPRSPVERNARKLMSPGALIASVATAEAMADAGWQDPRDIGFFMGVGASGADMSQLGAMIAASVDGETLSLGLLGEKGLKKANPLLAFLLMNNFSMCHSAILAGTRGPNMVLLSRGCGTVRALDEASYVLQRGEATRALVGGADSALHPVTHAELAREGRIHRGLIPSDGGAVLALSTSAGGARARLLHVGFGKELPSFELGESPRVVVHGWNDDATDAVSELASSIDREPVVASSLGDCLAGTPAITWLVALDLIASGRSDVVVLTTDSDGETAAVHFGRIL